MMGWRRKSKTHPAGYDDPLGTMRQQQPLLYSSHIFSKSMCWWYNAHQPSNKMKDKSCRGFEKARLTLAHLLQQDGERLNGRGTRERKKEESGQNPMLNGAQKKPRWQGPNESRRYMKPKRNYCLEPWRNLGQFSG